MRRADECGNMDVRSPWAAFEGVIRKAEQEETLLLLVKVKTLEAEARQAALDRISSEETLFGLATSDAVEPEIGRRALAGVHDPRLLGRFVEGFDPARFEKSGDILLHVAATVNDDATLLKG